MYILYFQRTETITSVNSSDGFSLVIVNNTHFYTYDGRMFVTNNNTIHFFFFFFFLYFRHTKAVTSVNSFGGFSSVIVNNIIFYIYDGRIFVTNNNTIKKYILYFRCTKAVASVSNSDSFYLVIVNNTLLAMNIFMLS